MRQPVALRAVAGWVALGLVAALAGRAPADEGRTLGAGLERAVRDLDGEELLVDQPAWVCTDPSFAPALEAPGWVPHFYELRGIDVAGNPIRARAAQVALAYFEDRVSGTSMPRGGEFTMTFGFHDPSGRAPLLEFANGIPAGEWTIHGHGADSARVLARFRVVEPRGSERFVRDGLARAARLAHDGADGAGGGEAQAARLYDAILRRYPRTSYLSVVYLGLWRVRQHTRFADDPDRWLEEIFARFHDTCFGTVALDQWVRDMGEERARRTVARLVGLYPDTPLSRAALRYLR